MGRFIRTEKRFGGWAGKATAHPSGNSGPPVVEKLIDPAIVKNQVCLLIIPIPEFTPHRHPEATVLTSILLRASRGVAPRDFYWGALQS